MKRGLKLSLVILGLVILALVIYLLIPKYNCGGDFAEEFNKAVSDNNPNFCLEFNGNLITNYHKSSKGGYYCKSPKVGLMDEQWSIRKSDFRTSCLSAFGAATKNVKACNLMEDGYDKDNCLLKFG
jgi:hypothetical protein